MRTIDSEPQAAFRARARQFLRYVVEHKENPLKTTWGAYGNFDVYALALLAEGGHDDEARRYLNATLDMIDRNFADERANPNNKWHLADFAAHPLIRAYFQYRGTHFPDDPVWQRIEKTTQGFLFHYGDLSENHNFLHLALRYLVGQTWPDVTLADGRKGSAHFAEARWGLRHWMRSWVTRGSAEWGSDIYYNVNLLSLLNLRDFAADPEMQRMAEGVLDTLALDEAVDSFAGSMVGAARRSYSVYRMDVRQSPARPLHYLWFNPPGMKEPFNLHFIGGVIQAATSDYLPPAAIRWIANQREPAENRATHLVGVWKDAPVNYLAKHTLRLPEVMQSTMNSPGGGDRYTEHVWQVTMGEEALVFSNHPTLSTEKDAVKQTKQITDALTRYTEPRPEQPAPGEAWYWIYGNVPPGHSGDVRPGYWQGSTNGPRTFGTGSLSFLVYNIAPDNPLPWAHVYLPRQAFDEVREDGNWVFLRRGTSYAALWLPGGYTATTQGFWADKELKLKGPRCAVLSCIGDAARDGGYENFIKRAKGLQPRWDEPSLTLSALPPEGGERISVSYENGPSQGGQKIDARGARIETPWGTMPLGSATLQLRTPAGEYNLDLTALVK